MESKGQEEHENMHTAKRSPVVILKVVMQLWVRPWYLSLFNLGVKEAAWKFGTHSLCAGSMYFVFLVMLSIWWGIGVRGVVILVDDDAFVDMISLLMNLQLFPHYCESNWVIVFFLISSEDVTLKRWIWRQKLIQTCTHSCPTIDIPS
jgi:hypothetical protein